MIDLIHIGDYKTSTSWWQTEMWPHHPEIYYLDNPRNHPEIVHLMHQLVDARDLDFDPTELERRFRVALENIEIGNKKKIICREALSGFYPVCDHAGRIADRLRSVFGNTKILIIIREQFSMLKAVYSQYIKIGGTLPFKAFVYDPVVSPGLIEKLKYHKIIETYFNLFGRDNVYVGLFEDFKLDNKKFVKNILKFIGCYDEWNIPSRSAIVNPSLSRIGLEVQRFVNHFLRNDYNPRDPIIPLDRLAGLFISGSRKKKLLEATRNRLIYSQPGRDDEVITRYAINFMITLYISKCCENINFGPKISIPKNIRQELYQEFVNSNVRLRDKYELPVDRYGWLI